APSHTAFFARFSTGPGFYALFSLCRVIPAFSLSSPFCFRTCFAHPYKSVLVYHNMPKNTTII
ncbi:hypothetical protein, partial [Hominenteromicrobium sp.]|uniref:hypothetical protein n=1 Tax=Hominenteromicrobium sp. TaxID=3073581 RepID=UPI003AF13027